MNKPKPLTAQSKPGKNQRYFALDVLRGLTIALMILVNTPGSWSHIYAPFKHAAWHGFTPTDWVFPSFLFVIGNAMSFSLRKYENVSEAAFLQKVFKRAALIFLIGLFLNVFPFVYREDGALVFKNLANLRIMGVLQRISLCYLFGSLIIHYLKLKKSIIFGGLILLGYWAILWFFGDSPNPFGLENNAALKFDQFIFRDANLYKGFGIPFDPEGLLSTLPAVVNVIAGYVAGVFIQKSGNNMKTIVKLSVFGVVLLGLGQIWDIWLPINKPIWTSSYVLFSTGWTLLVLSGFILIIEIFGFKKWTAFFEAFGRNPLFVFVMSGLVVMLMNIIYVNGQALKPWLYQNLYLSWLSDYNASLLFAISYMLLMWLLGFWLHKKRIYIKV
jgi:predicted acyltransferase